MTSVTVYETTVKRYYCWR